MSRDDKKAKAAAHRLYQKRNLKKQENEIVKELDTYKQMLADFHRNIDNFSYICHLVAEKHIDRYKDDPTQDINSDKWKRLSELKYFKNQLDQTRTKANEFGGQISMLKKARRDPALVLSIMSNTVIPALTDLQEKVTKMFTTFHDYIPKNKETLELVAKEDPNVQMLLVALEQAQEHMVKQALEEQANANNGTTVTMEEVDESEIPEELKMNLSTTDDGVQMIQSNDSPVAITPSIKILDGI